MNALVMAYLEQKAANEKLKKQIKKLKKQLKKGQK